MRRHRFGARVLLLSWALVPVEAAWCAPVRAEEQSAEEPASGGTVTAALDGRLVHGYGKVAGHFGWDMAGVGAIGALVGRNISHFQLSVRGMAGESIEGSWPCQGIGGDVGYRVIGRVHPKIRLEGMVAPVYLFRRSKDTMTGTAYRYHIPCGGLGVGVLFGGEGRLAHGVELAVDLGYAIQIAPSTGAPDYSGFFFSGGVGYMIVI